MHNMLYCYYCRSYHPPEEMRQIETKGRKRWRCIKSLIDSKQGAAAREAFGRRTTAENKERAKSIQRILASYKTG